MGDLVSAGGALISGASEQGAANAQKNIARQNAELADRNASLTMAAAEGQEERLGMRARAQAGKVKAEQAGSGLDLKSGSAVDVRNSMKALSMFDSMTLKSNAAREAFGFKLKAQEFRNEAAIAKNRANQAMVSAGFNAFSSLVSGAQSANTAYSQWQNASAAGESTGFVESPEVAALLAF